MTQTYKVVVTDYDYPDLDREKRIIEEFGAEFVPCNCKTEEEVIEKAWDADALLNQYALLTPKVLGALKKCKVIVRYGIGVDSINIPAATKAGILVCNVPRYGIHEVSDHSIGMLFACIRKLSIMNQMVKNGIWDVHRGRPIYRIYQTTLGLVAFGNIPRMVSQKLKPWNLKILAYDPYLTDDVFLSYGVTRASLDQVLTESDYISCHLPLTDETRYFFTYERFKQMKKGAVFVNTARGGVVDEKGLYQALKEEWLSAVALDVMEQEPPRDNHPLFDFSNVILTPHMAWYSEQAARDLRRMTAEEVVRVLKGEKPHSCLNPEAMKR